MEVRAKSTPTAYRLITYYIPHMAGKFDIFISYRRKGGYDTAKLLYDRLRLDGYAVSFDIDTLEKGDFDKELESRVRECKDFLVVLNHGIFDRFYDPECDPKDDWVRREIACALAENKNIVPLVLEGFEWPKNALPPEVKDITRKNGIDLNPKHFEAAYATLKRRFLDSQPSWTVRHKKKIITAISLAFLIIFAFLTFLYFNMTEEMSEISREKEQKELQIQLEKQRIDSLAKEMHKRDSAIRRQDSIRQERQERRRLDSIRQDSLVKAAGKKATVKSSGRTLHWIGSSDAIGTAIFEKLIPAGAQKTKCSDNGININVTKPTCNSSDKNITCSYSPKLALTDCDGKLLGAINIGTAFLAESQTDEATARKELADELRSSNFKDVISAIEGYK